MMPSQTFDIAEEQIIMRAGIDPMDFEDIEIQQLLGVMNEEKRGLYGSETDEDEMDKYSDNEDND